ncbi:MAG: PepSY-associated TM helix domain-containing protein [Methylovulum sp.]|nr:PepSY-associated TM helix domain-containing protein [Methylovulum sp.]
MRKICLRLHRYLGLTVALFLLQASLTGSILAFQQELDTWLNPELFESPGRGQPLSTTELIGHLQRQFPQYRVVSLPLQREAGKATRIAVRPPVGDSNPVVAADELFVDPVDGKLLGSRIWGACCFERKHLIPFIHVLHYSLQLPGDYGLWAMGSIAIAWLVEVLVGCYLTLPKLRIQPQSIAQSPAMPAGGQKTWLQRWGVAWRVKPKASKIRLTFDLHRAGGLWLLIPMLILSVSGIAMNLHEAVFEPVVSVVSDFTPSPFDAREPRLELPPVEPTLRFDAILQMAAENAGQRGWSKPAHSIFYNPDFGMFGVGFGENGGLGPWYLYFDGTNGAYLGDYVPGTGTAADIFDAWQLPLHSGQVIGLYGRTLISLAGAALTLLVVTGLLIWLHKQKAKQMT